MIEADVGIYSVETSLIPMTMQVDQARTDKFPRDVCYFGTFISIEFWVQICNSAPFDPHIHNFIDTLRRINHVATFKKQVVFAANLLHNQSFGLFGFFAIASRNPMHRNTVISCGWKLLLFRVVAAFNDLRRPGKPRQPCQKELPLGSAEEFSSHRLLTQRIQSPVDEEARN